MSKQKCLLEFDSPENDSSDGNESEENGEDHDATAVVKTAATVFHLLFWWILKEKENNFKLKS